jgi:hypothetical protein
MVRAQLMGGHSHHTLVGVQVHVWQRGGKFLARGRYQGQPFGATLGSNVAEATPHLRQVLTQIEDGSFVRPSEARQRPLSSGPVPRLNLRQLISDYLAEKRKLLGQRTAHTYRARLMPDLDFAEQPVTRRRWPLVRDVDRAFAVELRSFLHAYQTTRNGRPGGRPKPLSGRQVFNILECLRSLLAWARRPEVRKLPADWANPLTLELRGDRPAKDPLREDKLPMEKRLCLVATMDRWQLCHLTLSMVLPLRPEEAAGLLVTDVRFDKGWLEFGTRAGGGDFTKGRQTFKLPFPDELTPMLQACISDRAQGPLLRSRAAFAGCVQRSVASAEELARLYEEKLATAARGSVQTEQDRKQVFRRLLRELGGVSPDQLALEFKHLLQAHGWADSRSLYTLRGSVTTSMERAKLPHLEMRYLTGHTTTDILNANVALDPVGAMRLYFNAIRPLLEACTRQAEAVGLSFA